MIIAEQINAGADEPVYEEGEEKEWSEAYRTAFHLWVFVHAEICGGVEDIEFVEKSFGDSNHFIFMIFVFLLVNE